MTTNLMDLSADLVNTPDENHFDYLRKTHLASQILLMGLVSKHVGSLEEIMDVSDKLEKKVLSESNWADFNPIQLIQFYKMVKEIIDQRVEFIRTVGKEIDWAKIEPLLMNYLKIDGSVEVSEEESKSNKELADELMNVLQTFKDTQQSEDGTNSLPQITGKAESDDITAGESVEPAQPIVINPDEQEQ